MLREIARTQQSGDKNKLYAMHAPEVECIGKGRASRPCEFGQTSVLLQDIGVAPKQVVVDLGDRGVDDDNPGVEIIHRGKYKPLAKQQRRWLRMAWGWAITAAG